MNSIQVKVQGQGQCTQGLKWQKMLVERKITKKTNCGLIWGDVTYVAYVNVIYLKSTACMAFVFSKSTTTEIIHFFIAALFGPLTVFN